MSSIQYISFITLLSCSLIAGIILIRSSFKFEAGLILIGSGSSLVFQVTQWLFPNQVVLPIGIVATEDVVSMQMSTFQKCSFYSDTLCFILIGISLIFIALKAHKL